MSAEIEPDVELDLEFNKISLKDDEIKSFPATCIIPSTQLHVFKRLLHEIEDVNKDFHSLRTVIIVDPEEHINLFYFVMFPNDGAIAHLPVYGRMIITNEYPTNPPVLHLFTKTLRYNVDVFSHVINTSPPTLSSSMCFDVLKPKLYGGTWESQLSISCLFASLMQALVSYMVPQQYGEDLAEFVTMEKLASIKKNVEEAQKTYQSYFTKVPKIPLVLATPCKAQKLVFPKTMEPGFGTTEKIYSSKPFYLQNNSPSNQVTISLDLTNLQKDTVFSVILSNSTTDFTGKNRDTILVRNGVTGSAAKKTKVGQTKWFYHGIPLISDKGLKITITIAKNQFVIVYWKDDKPIVHGDTPISYLKPAQIGDVSSIPFYLNIFLKKKSQSNTFSSITTFVTESGYVQ